MSLASYAITEHNSEGRQYEIDKPTDRNEFERDYDRVLHSGAHRKLRAKTQVFPHDAAGDIFRSRYDHSMEVCGIAKAVSNALNINQHLASTLAICHDIGHAPFGHLGQDTLDELMVNHGGFEHNVQALRIVDKLESPYYPLYEGLNLMFETRAGLLKHCSEENALILGPVAQRHLLGRQGSLESQVVDYADSMAYVHADLEDAFMLHILSPKELHDAPGYLEAWGRVQKRHPDFELPSNNDYMNGGREEIRKTRGIVRTIIRDMLSHSMNDLKSNSLMRIRESGIVTVDDVKGYHEELIRFSDNQFKLHKDLKRFSKANIYDNPIIDSNRQIQKQMIIDLFNAYSKDPSEMSGNGVDPKEDFYRSLADHISGMTDRFAVMEHKRILEERPELIVRQSRRMSMSR